MAHGITHGNKHNPVHGVKHGALTLGLNATLDATSRIYVPATAAEWTSVMSAAGISSGGPADLWLCQEASGNLTDSIGATTLSATGAGRVYQHPVSGWSRVAVQTSAEDTVSRWTVGAGTGPNPSTTSVLYMWYIDATTAGGGRQLFMCGGNAGATELGCRLAAASHAIEVKVGTNVTAGTLDSLAGGVRPYIVRNDRTAATVTTFNDIEKVAGVYLAGLSDGGKGIGSDNNGPITCAIADYLYGVAFTGAAAELTDAQVKTLLQTLGWAVSWT